MNAIAKPNEVMFITKSEMTLDYVVHGSYPCTHCDATIVQLFNLWLESLKHVTMWYPWYSLQRWGSFYVSHGEIPSSSWWFRKHSSVIDIIRESRFPDSSSKVKTEYGETNWISQHRRRKPSSGKQRDHTFQRNWQNMVDNVNWLHFRLIVQIRFFPVVHNMLWVVRVYAWYISVVTKLYLVYSYSIAAIGSGWEMEVIILQLPMCILGSPQLDRIFFWTFY